jgi:hypothetical protein
VDAEDGSERGDSSDNLQEFEQHFDFVGNECLYSNCSGTFVWHRSRDS